MDLSENEIDYVEGGSMKEGKTLERFGDGAYLFCVTCTKHGDVASKYLF